MGTAIRSRWRRFGDYLARWPWSPTPEGVAWIVLTLIVLVQGWIRGFNLVVFIATFLVGMWALNGISTLFFVRRKLRPLRFHRRFVGAVHAGAPVQSVLEVENPGKKPVLGLRVVDAGSDHRNVVGIHELQSKRTTEITTQIVPVRRGYYEWKPLHVSCGYPFGLFRRSLIVPPEEKTTLVLPMLGKLDERQFRRWLRTSQRISPQLTKERPRRSMAPADFYGIRSYRSGDSPRWIHWRTTARVGQLMVREFEEPPQQHLTVILEAWLPEVEHDLHSKWRQARRENIETIRMLIATLGPPTPEQRVKKEAELAKKELTFRKPLDLVERAVSLTATLAWSWTRKLGSNVTLGVVDGLTDHLQVFDASPALRTIMPAMERLARVEGSPEPKSGELINQLDQRKIPRGPMVLISTHGSNLHKHLSQAIGRPVQLLDVSQSTVERFFVTQAGAVLEE
jgi:hypothetical protein